ncbi:MAG: hypothetical protein V4574_00215 [Pseudomonadota bacterium]
MNMNLSIDVSNSNDMAAWVNIGIASVALLVAFLSIVLSWWSLRNQDRHNRFSVRPIPFLHLRTQGRFIQVELVNDGPGLYQIKEYILDMPNRIDHNIFANLPRPVSSVEIYTTTGLKDRTIPPRGGFNILKIVAKNESGEAENYLNECLNIIGGMTITIEYTDVYKGKFKNYVKSLDWFRTQTIRLVR